MHPIRSIAFRGFDPSTGWVGTIGRFAPTIESTILMGGELEFPVFGRSTKLELWTRGLLDQIGPNYAMKRDPLESPPPCLSSSCIDEHISENLPSDNNLILAVDNKLVGLELPIE